MFTYNSPASDFMTIFMAETEKSATTLKHDYSASGSLLCFGFGYNGFSQLANNSVADEVHKEIQPSNSVLTPFVLDIGRIHSVVASWSSNLYLKENGLVSVSGWIPGTKDVGKQENFLPSFIVTDACSSWTMLSFLTKDGECLLWKNYTIEKSVPRKVKAMGSKFRAVGCRETSCILLTDKGQVGSAVCEQDQDCLDSGKAEFLFEPMDVKTQISSIACGKEHALLLSSSGDVLSLGGGSRGQLGCGLTVDEQSPAVVAALEGIRIQFIAAGGWHSAAISEFGDLYMWGWNEKGQLGLAFNHGNVDDSQPSSHPVQCQVVPAIVNIPGDLDVLTVSCGTRHTAVVAGDGSVWTWGWGNYGQLGHDDSKDKNSPCEVGALSSLKHKPKTVCCGDWSTFVIISK
ncbi:RCC1 domain-containing protein 1-like [Montipora foliosa]|uniref:RCC1 domain-containing protein 1-like n=1 Tax=Montipora foliosa TaxID=591990 RepID=UPI0035F10C49